jgi:hopanoid biosynthesis associated protein HpnK
MVRSGRKLIVTADDFGLTGGVNDAIATACRGGILTTASLMVNGPAYEAAVEIAQREQRLDVGLHLNLTEGRPVAKPASIPSIADERGFLHKHPVQLAGAAVRGKIAPGDLEREIRAQIEKALDSGIPITHIDGHKHVHIVPAILSILSRILSEYGIGGIRCTRERVPRLASLLARSRRSWIKVAKQRAFGKVLSIAWSMQSRRLPSGLAAPKKFYGITQTGFLDIMAFRDIVHDLDEGVHELMCHPGRLDDDLRRTPTRLLAQRERELELLTGSEARRVLNDAGVHLTTYRDLIENHENRRPNPVLHRYSSI